MNIVYIFFTSFSKIAGKSLSTKERLQLVSQGLESCRKHYAELKSGQVANERRYKKLKRKEREKNERAAANAATAANGSNSEGNSAASSSNGVTNTSGDNADETS